MQGAKGFASGKSVPNYSQLTLNKTHRPFYAGGFIPARLSHLMAKTSTNRRAQQPYSAVLSPSRRYGSPKIKRLNSDPPLSARQRRVRDPRHSAPANTLAAPQCTAG